VSPGIAYDAFKFLSSWAEVRRFCAPESKDPYSESVVPTGLRPFCSAHPALKRWAKLYRTYGADSCYFQPLNQRTGRISSRDGLTDNW